MNDSLQRTHFLNGKFVTESELVVSIRDLGFMRGFAVFDFLITYPHHRPFMLEKHIDRLFSSADHIGLAIPWSKAQVQKWILQTLEANKSPDEKAIKIIISGGLSNSLIPNSTPTIVILIDPRNLYPREYFENGVSVITVKHNRYAPYAKSNNYIEGVKQAQIAAETGAIEPIYYDDTQVFEGSTSNIFAVINNKLVTPKSNALPGITRDVLLSILKLDIPIETRDFTLEQLCSASEAFLTASNKEIIPITKIDGNAVGEGRVGSITKEAMRQFQELTRSDRW